MPELNRNKKWRALFVAVSVLILMQVIWWTTAFLRTVDKVAQLETRLIPLLGNQNAINERYFHSKMMFLSEGITFLILICFGLYLLFRSLKLEQKTLEIQRNFSEILTHESKTPLTALKLRLESIIEKYASQAGKEEALSRELKLSLDEVRRLASIIEKAISLNRIEASHFVFDEVALDEVVKQVVKRLDPLFKSHGVEVLLKMDGESIVKADFLALQNTVQSLIENAVYYNDKTEKKVTVEIQKTVREVILTVSDNGPGITAKESEKIFDRFYRGISVKRIPGTGLGLYLSRLIVEAHRGVLKLADTGKMGSSFEVHLPLYGGTL